MKSESGFSLAMASQPFENIHILIAPKSGNCLQIITHLILYIFEGRSYSILSRLLSATLLKLESLILQSSQFSWCTLSSSHFSRFFVCTPPGKKGLGRMDGAFGGEAAEEAGEEGGGEGE